MSSSIDIIRVINRDSRSVGNRLLDHSPSLPSLRPVEFRQYFSPGKRFSAKYLFFRSNYVHLGRHEIASESTVADHNAIFAGMFS